LSSKKAGKKRMYQTDYSPDCPIIINVNVVHVNRDWYLAFINQLNEVQVLRRTVYLATV